MFQGGDLAQECSIALTPGVHSAAIIAQSLQASGKVSVIVVFQTVGAKVNWEWAIRDEDCI